MNAVLLAAAALPAPCGAADVPEAPPLAPVFAAEAPLQLELAAPFATLSRQRGEDRPWQDARLSYTDQAGAQVPIELRIRVRGRSRTRSGVCDFPPLLLDFPKPALAGTLFDGENRLKLVTHCRNDRAHLQHVLLEYLGYRILNILTDTSLRARLVEVRYVEAARQDELFTRTGFLLEDEARFGARMQLTPLEVGSLERTRYDAAALALVEVFEYFIGNTDWSALAGPPGEPCCHNIVPYADPAGLLRPVPYDFDSAGLVDAPYALPYDSLPIRKVRQRLYRGGCYDAGRLQAVFDRFRAAREPIMALLDQQPGLSARSRGSTRTYLEQFYRTISDPDRARRAFVDRCRP